LQYAAALFLPATARIVVTSDPSQGHVTVDVYGAEDTAAFEAWIADNAPLAICVTVRKIDRVASDGA
jgi:hypothetical protein